ncbi:MAG TPA: hypothetical protein VKH64_14505 [Candidatus Binatia bacterium]|nr:hypothetical protein [Candidatus Binatia bacterium]
MAPPAYRRANRPVYLAVAALFVSFLAYSAPHQVHHIFEHSHAARPAPCQAFAVAKNCHLAVAAMPVFSFAQAIPRRLAPAAAFSVSQSFVSPTSARAPPLA